MLCLKTTFFMRYRAICGEFFPLPSAACTLNAVGEIREIPGFVLMGLYWGLICIEWLHTHADGLDQLDH